MPTRVYSKVLYAGPAALSTSSLTLFTVPAGHTYIVRTVTLENSSGAARLYTWRFRGPAHLADVIMRRLTIASLGYEELATWKVFSAGDQLRLRSDASHSADVCVFGYDLDET